MTDRWIRDMRPELPRKPQKVKRLDKTRHEKMYPPFPAPQKHYKAVHGRVRTHRLGRKEYCVL